MPQQPGALTSCSALGSTSAGRSGPGPGVTAGTDRRAGAAPSLLCPGRAGPSARRALFVSWPVSMSLDPSSALPSSE